MNGPLSPVGALRLIAQITGDKNLTPAQRLVLVWVVLRADDETGLAWAAYRKITKKTGLAPATIRAALRYAEGRYLRCHARGDHNAIQYALQPVKRTSRTETPLLQPVKRSASQDETNLAPSLTPDSHSPPTPPADAGLCVVFPAAQEPQSEAEAVALGEAAYHAVFETGLPLAFKRRVKREFASGDKAALGRMDAEAMRGGRKLAKDAGRTFGFGWVMRFIADQAADRQAATLQRQRAETTARLQQQRRESENQQRQAEARAQMEHFAALSNARRAEYRRLAKEKKFAPKRADLLDAMAARLAWQDKSPEYA